MSANVEDMAYVGEKPWHELGTRVPDDIGREALIQAAGLDWTVSTHPVLAKYRAEQKDAPTMQIEAPQAQAVVRDDNHAVLGVVGNRYSPIQNEVLFDFTDDLIESGNMRFETAGALGKGERVWVLLSGDVFEVAEGDKIEQYILVTSSHDGSSKFTAYPTPVRVVCQNTMLASMRRVKDSVKFDVRHTESAEEKIAQAGEVVERSLEYFGELETVFVEMLNSEYSIDDFDRLLKNVLYPLDPEEEERSDQMQQRISDIKHLFTNSDFSGTAWGAYNAVTEYVDHHKNFRKSSRYSENENRMRSVLWGGARRMKDKAMEGISDQTGVEI